MLYDGQTNVPTSCNIDSFDRDELERAARTWQAIRRAVNYIGRKSMASVTRNIFRHRHDFSIELNLESVWLVKLFAGRVGVMKTIQTQTTLLCLLLDCLSVLLSREYHMTEMATTKYTFIIFRTFSQIDLDFSVELPNSFTCVCLPSASPTSKIIIISFTVRTHCFNCFRPILW